MKLKMVTHSNGMDKRRKEKIHFYKEKHTTLCGYPLGIGNNWIYNKNLTPKDVNCKSCLKRSNKK